jgi:hypothetical protein
MGLFCTQTFAAITWTNAKANNDFADLGNWGNPATLGGQDCTIGLSGTNKAILSTTLSANPKSIQVDATSPATGELVISGGTNTLTGGTLRVGYSAGKKGALTITGGSLTVMDSYTTIGGNGVAIMTMSGGTLTADRITFGQTTAGTTVNMTGGTINITQKPTSTTSTSGSLRMGAGNPNLYISGTAVINADKFYINEGGLITMNGGAIYVNGTIDSNPTFNFTEAEISSMLGKVEFNSGLFQITGNYASLFDAAIASGNIYTTVAGKSVDAQYADGYTTLTLVVPEPVTLVVLGLGGLLFARRK